MVSFFRQMSLSSFRPPPLFILGPGVGQVHRRVLRSPALLPRPVLHPQGRKPRRHPIRYVQHPHDHRMQLAGQSQDRCGDAQGWNQFQLDFQGRGSCLE